MNSAKHISMFTTARLALLIGAASLLAAPLAGAQSDPFRVNPAKVLGAENCAECHASMIESWKLTHHNTTFNDMHRTEKAKEIGDKMGVRRMKTGGLCINCHYTTQGDGDKLTAISGISCESCHNAGADWNKIHSDKENPNRLAQSEKLGMLRPSNYYHVAANCFSCHTVPEEKLVNVGGHPAGSDFELVAWSQGEVRHNMQETAGKENKIASKEEQRMLYIVGCLLDLEYGLRGLAAATEDGNYSKAMISRVGNAKKRLESIQAVAKAAPLQQVITLAAGAPLAVGKKAEIMGVADKIAVISKEFSATKAGANLAAIDSMLPAAGSYKGTAYVPAQ